MACGCNGICSALNCPTNVACYGHQPVCSGNTYNFSNNPNNPVSAGVLIEAQHVADLEVAINNEKVHATRRGPSDACGTNCSDSYTFTGNRSVGDDIEAVHFDNVRDANDITSYATVFPDGIFNIGDIITAAKVVSLQNTINSTRQNCICNSHLSCNPHCCNLNCPFDDPGYLPN